MKREISFDDFKTLSSLAVSLPKGNVREANKWMKRIASEPTRDSKRTLANRFIRKHRPQEKAIADIIRFVEA